jgi:hypothetical protein
MAHRGHSGGVDRAPLAASTYRPPARRRATRQRHLAASRRTRRGAILAALGRLPRGDYNLLPPLSPSTPFTALTALTAAYLALHLPLGRLSCGDRARRRAHPARARCHIGRAVALRRVLHALMCYSPSLGHTPYPHTPCAPCAATLPRRVSPQEDLRRPLASGRALERRGLHPLPQTARTAPRGLRSTPHLAAAR